MDEIRRLFDTVKEALKRMEQESKVILTFQFQRCFIMLELWPNYGIGFVRSLGQLPWEKSEKR